MNDNINIISLYYDFNESKYKQKQTYAMIINNENVLNNNNDENIFDNNNDKDLFIVFCFFNI